MPWLRQGRNVSDANPGWYQSVRRMYPARDGHILRLRLAGLLQLRLFTLKVLIVHSMIAVAAGLALASLP